MNTKYHLLLIEKYRSITLSQAKEAFCVAEYPANFLTGFGSAESCMLCEHLCCEQCYGCEIDSPDRYHSPCAYGDHKETYINICKAHTPEDLIEAFNNRADHIENWLKTIKRSL